MRRTRVVGAVALALAASGAALGLGLTTSGPDPATASSHREAPLISEDPSADNTDLYAFRSPDAPDTLTILANWIPGEDPAAGPTWYRFSPRARYNIYIDRDGDGVADITYRFYFKTSDPDSIFLGNTIQSYSVYRQERGVGGKFVALNIPTAPNNIGPRTYPNFEQLAQDAIQPLDGGGQVFAGQREDPFFGDIGAIFDLVAIRKGFDEGGKDFFSGYGVHTIALQIPIASLGDPDGIVGIYAGTDRKVAYVNGVPRYLLGEKQPYRQVSRLGNPLFNELIVPTKLKDYWNARHPSEDADYVRFTRKPILAGVLNQLYKINAPETKRDDLVQVFLTGVPGLNKMGDTPADLLRINLNIEPTTDPAKFSRLGVLGGDLAGYPNGRRLQDDVIDIAERAVAGALVGNVVPLGDGVNGNERTFTDHFPYVRATHSGYDNTKGDCAGQREEVGEFADPSCDGEPTPPTG